VHRIGLWVQLQKWGESIFASLATFQHNNWDCSAYLWVNHTIVRGNVFVII